jgi:hypothetical protein
MAGNPSGKKDFTSGGTKPLVTYGFPQNSIIMLLRDGGKPVGEERLYLWDKTACHLRVPGEQHNNAFA